MKKFITLLLVLFLLPYQAQTTPIAEKTLDEKLVNINKSTFTSGVLYQRSSTFTNLYEYNRVTDFNTATVDFFEQSINDLYYASNKTKFIDFATLRNRISANKYIENKVDVGMINTSFHILNYNEENPSTGGLLYNESTQLFSQIAGKAPFVEMQTSIIAPLKKEAKGTSVTYSFRNDLLFTNGTKAIKTLIANLGDGINRNIITNGVFSPQNISVNYTSTGDKLLTFSIVYTDNTSVSTYGKLYFTLQDAIAKTTATCYDTNLVDNFSITSDKEFKGYDEAYAFRGKFDYRVFYRKKGNTEKKIRKPIIIIDGFDPGDKRKIFACEMPEYKERENFSIQDMMTYPYMENGITKYRDLIQHLRDNGYDVTIVNHPTYCIRNTAPYDVVDCTPNARVIDGGADYIERNALTLATLIKEFNTQLKTNGSTEKLAIVGPSMGGQTSRYALAYLEKMGINHNTRLWVSIDSPHLGANIPLGDQALLYLASKKAHSVKAQDFYDKQLNSVASKQQLIELHKPLDNNETQVDESYLNGRTVSQGFSINSGNPYFQNYYNNQFNNGLPNSKGYPQNLRKIALVNGSLTGSKTVMSTSRSILPNGDAGSNVINIKGFTVLPFTITGYPITMHIASLESYFMPAYSSPSIKIAKLKKGFYTYTVYSRNINNRGSLDAVSGGWFGAQNDIVKPLLGKSPVDGVRGSFWQYSEDNIGFWFANEYGRSFWELTSFKPTNSFIPTFSALGIKTPDKDWGESLQRNLVCTGETPFDSYYGTSENTQHTSFTEESVNWLMKELGDFQTSPSPQAPSFPIDATQFSGATNICINSTSTYSFGDLCRLPSNVAWSVNNSNAQIISSTANSVVLKGISSGAITLTARFQNGQELTKKIWVGLPVYGVTQINDPDYYNESHFYINSTTPTSEQGVTQIKWTQLSSTDPTARLYASLNATEGFARGYDNSWEMEVKVEITNACGTNTQIVTISPPAFAGCDGYKVAKSSKGNNAYIIIDPCAKTTTSAKLNDITTEINDVRGNKIIQTNSLEFSLENQLPGAYYLRITKNNQVVHTEKLLKN